MDTTPAIDKSQWPRGPWDEEPDLVEFAHAGYQCLMYRHPTLGMWMGKVFFEGGAAYFDCGHIFQLAPGMVALERELGLDKLKADWSESLPPELLERYVPLAEARRICEEMAEELRRRDTAQTEKSGPFGRP